MHFLWSKPVALLVTAIVLADGHLIMKTPVPYGADHIDTNPLLPDGSDFPCKQRSNVYKLIKQNVMQVGQNQTLSFQGQATHGGGTCQISLTTDKQPTKHSVWKVILTIEGGCPSTNPGNVGNDPFGYGADHFHFAIPPQVPLGGYTLAWTWFNKIGDREMYMNCAPITVTGASHKRRAEDKPALEKGEVIQKRALSSLPDMFVANIGSGCSSPPSGSTLAIPQQNLGTIVQRIGSDALTPPTGNCGQGVAKPPTQAGPQASVQTPNPESPASPSPFVFLPLDSPQSRPTALAAPPPPPVPSTSQPKPSAAPPIDPHPSASQPNSSGGNNHGLSSGSCSTPGKSVCSPDGKGIGTCDQFNRVIFTPVPPGTICDKTLGVEVHARRRRILGSIHGRRKMI
ncbi:MAG: hypothetical protein LQ342_007857 [Letrouitia transgressa]|nr:MAG: hypothetical protein LQ342_007857 [Letrouitia transgressa]